MSIKEEEIVDYFLSNTMFDDVLKIVPVQKQTRAGQRTKFKAFVVVGNFKDCIGLGIKSAKEVAIAVKGAVIIAKLSIIPVRKGFWGEKTGNPYTIPIKITGKAGSIRVRCIPAPKGAGIVSARVPKKLLMLSGYEDIFTSSKGYTRTLGNFAKATFSAIYLSYNFITPDLWDNHIIINYPYDFN